MDDGPVADVARRVRAARTQSGLSLEQLSARAGVSKGALVSVEAASGNPNLATLVRLADALGTSVTALLEQPSGPSVRTVATDEVEPLWHGPEGGWARLLLTTAGPAPVELWRWHLRAGESYESSAHPGGVIETLTCLRGDLTVVVDGTGHRVPEGSTITFAASVPHGYRADPAGECDVLMTVHLPPQTSG